MKFVLIPAGKFMMGSPEGEKDRVAHEGPQHEVMITKPFHMGMYEVTQEQWTAVMGTMPWKGKEETKEGATHPATHMSWNDATDFCKKLSTKTGKTVSLPTEAQWEYACRAGSKTRFCYGDDDDYSKLGDYAWYRDNALRVGEGYAHAVGQKKANAWGLYDMHGNVYEWCADCWEDSYTNAAKTNPTGPASGEFRVVRSGNFAMSPVGRCRSASRCHDEPDYASTSGLRVVVLQTASKSQIDKRLAMAAMFLANAKSISDLDKAESHVREGKKLLDGDRRWLGAEECAKQLSKINDVLSEIAKERRAIAETKAEGL